MNGVDLINKKAKQLIQYLNDEVITYIASNIGNDVRQLEGSITRLIAYSVIMCENNITVEEAKAELKAKYGEPEKPNDAE